MELLAEELHKILPPLHSQEHNREPSQTIARKRIGGATTTKMKTLETLSAVQHIRKMRGGSQAQLIRASDHNFYVTKFQNNPQHIRVLASEYLGTMIGLCLGLPMPEVRSIDVYEWLIAHTPDLRIEIGGQSVPC